MAKESPSKMQIFLEKLSQLEQFTEAEQKQKIEEMNEIVDGMNEEEFRSIFMSELFDEIHTKIEKKMISLENMCLLLKHIGIYKETNHAYFQRFGESSMGKRVQKMIIEENEKKSEEKNEKLLIDICECFIFLNDENTSQLFSICVPYLLKAALNKEENEKAQKDVEIALLALSNVGQSVKMSKKLYMNEIKEIVQYHQEHRNLTQHAYALAFRFLINRLSIDWTLKYEIVSEMNYLKEARRELEELMKCIDWKRKEVERGKEAKETCLLMRWIQSLDTFLNSCILRNEEHYQLLYIIAGIFRAVKDNHRYINDWCIFALGILVIYRDVQIDSLLKSGAIDVTLRKMIQLGTIDLSENGCLKIFKVICEKLKGKTDNEANEAKRKEEKRKTFEKLEEEGYEDFIVSFRQYLVYGTDDSLVSVKNIEDYFVCC